MIAASASCDVFNSFLSNSSSHVHMYVMSLTEPTCTEKGNATYVCTSCGDSFERDYLGAKGHTYVDRECVECGELKPSEGLEYRLINDGTAYSVWGMGVCTDTELVIPSIHEGKPVTAIENEAFVNNADLTRIVIPESIASIGTAAFAGCTKLTEITVKEGNENYKSIDDHLYTKNGKTLVQYACGKKADCFVVPDRVATLGYGSFGGLNLTSLVIPKSLTEVEMIAFLWCSNLANVYYAGNEEDWQKISIDMMGNSDLTSATRYYYSETEPTGEGNYWHYDENGEIAVWKKETV